MMGKKKFNKKHLRWIIPLALLSIIVISLISLYAIKPEIKIGGNKCYLGWHGRIVDCNLNDCTKVVILNKSNTREFYLFFPDRFLTIE